MRTKNQETLDRILKFVNKYYQEHHSSPTINDVAEGVGVARSTTHRYLQELSDRNLIDYGRDRACATGGRRLQQPLEFDQCRGEQLIFSPENRKSCGLCPLGKN